MAKLWDKGYAINASIESFTVGDDYLWDVALVQFDCLGSIAHAQMLLKIGVLTTKEFNVLKKSLCEIIALADQGAFAIKPSDEDVHTAIENYLVKQCGTIGKKIHTARSRNDQILLDMRLYMKEELINVMDGLVAFCSTLQTVAEQYSMVPMPGRTHFQKAMPSSVGLLMGAYLESMLDNAVLVSDAYKLIDQCPLGSAAGYGVNMPIDRQLVSDLLGFSKVQNNVLYVSNSRGKYESIVLSCLVQIMMDLSKIATDCIIFSAPEFGYFTLPDQLCTGSSLMPQKKNPDVLELIRARSATVLSCHMQVLEIIRGLPSGYNRDFQEIKKPLMQGLMITKQCIALCDLVIGNIHVNTNACINACTPEIFATDQALLLVQQGVPFREAYKKIALLQAHMPDNDPVENIKSKKHMGAPGDLGLPLSSQKIKKITVWNKTVKERNKKTFLTLKG
jgi:argininosuccinate lyase